MKSKVFRGVLMILVSSLALNMFSGCGNNNKKIDSKYIADPSYLYGVCYIAYEEVVSNGVTDYAKTAELMNNMGVKSIRVWMRSNDFMSNKDTMIRANCDKMHDILAELKKYDFQIIGMNARSFTKFSNYSSSVPLRDWSDGSYYSQWIEDLSTMWTNLVTEFSEVDYWEIGNETNNKRKFIYYEKGEWKESSMSISQMANVFTDELYYVTQAIHSVDPNKMTILGGMTESTGLGSGLNKNYLKMIYKNIASGNYPSTDPDDYFDAVAWHPYSSGFDEDFFVEKNDEIYQVILDNEGKSKKVFLTEVGWTDSSNSKETNADYLERLYTVVKERMPYVEAVHYFRMFNDAREMGWDPSGHHVGFGLICDPNPGTKYKDEYQGVVNIPGEPKPAAYAFQRVSGGIGDLTILQNYFC